MFLLVVQLISALLLLYVGLPMPGVRNRAGDLTRCGKYCLVFGAVSLVVSIVIASMSAQAEQHRLNERIDGLFTELSTIVMMLNPATTHQTHQQVSSESISISEPSDGESVAARELLSGAVEDRGAAVWLIVRPVGINAFWVQPPVTVRWSGKWSVVGYFGRGGNIDVGKEFELMAVANPTQELREGQVLNGWPEARWQSEVVSVVRRGS